MRVWGKINHSAIRRIFNAHIQLDNMRQCFELWPGFAIESKLILIIFYTLWDGDYSIPSKINRNKCIISLFQHLEAYTSWLGIENVAQSIIDIYLFHVYFDKFEPHLNSVSKYAIYDFYCH